MHSVIARKIAALIVLGVTLAGCSMTATQRPAGTPTAPAAPAMGSTWKITAVPETPPPTEAAAAPSPPVSPAPMHPTFTRVTVDGWRYGVAWTGFSTDTGTADQPTTPGEVNISFTMRFRFADNRRPTEPPPDVFGNSLGWAAYISNHRLAAQNCPDDYMQQPCEVTFGVLYEGCTPVDTSHTESYGTVLIQTCSSGPYPDGVSPRDFKIEYAWTDFDTGKAHHVPLAYQG